MDVSKWPMPVRIAACFSLVIVIALEGVGAMLLVHVALWASTEMPPFFSTLCWASAAAVAIVYLRHTAAVLAGCLTAAAKTGDLP